MPSSDWLAGLTFGLMLGTRLELIRINMMQIRNLTN